MKNYRLDFADIIDHEDGIVEVIVDEGMSLKGIHFHELHDLMESLPSNPAGFLVNRKNSYSMEFSVFPSIRYNKVIRAVAVANNGRKPQMVIERFWPKFLKLAFFDGREEAYSWLQEKIIAERKVG